MEKFIDDDRIHEGHRGRMRAKLFAHGQHIFDTYELLEMLLYNSVPLKDTNPISKRLLHAFSGLNGVFCAKKEELMCVEGVGARTAELICSVGRLSEIIGAEVVCGDEIDLSSYEAVGAYFVDFFSGMEEKCVAAIFLDSSMRLISVKKLYDLEYDSGGVRAKPFIDEAVASRAAVVISAHNHPFGPFFPTSGDRATNTVITDALNLAGFVHAEHYIISGNNYAGIRSINNFTSRLGIMPAISQFLNSREIFDDEVMQVRSVQEKSGKSKAPLGDIYNKQDLDYFTNLMKFACGSSNEISLALLRRYRTIENVFTASVRELISASNEKCAFFAKILAYVTSRRVTDGFVFGKPHSSAEIAEYFKALFLGESVEKIYIMTFDSTGAVIGCNLLAEGTVTSSEILPRKAVEIAVSAGASSVSVAHNHPFGTTRASNDDINITKLFAAIFRSCDIVLNEHYIIAGQLCGTISMDFN